VKFHAPLNLDYILKRLRVDLESGDCFWIDPGKNHPSLRGKLAGSAKRSQRDKWYWIIPLDGTPYLRSQIVFTAKTGVWPLAKIDHKDGNSLNDRADNLRAATIQQNNWNHSFRAKASPLPMGVRRTTSGKYQARITVDYRPQCLGTFDSPAGAAAAYQEARQRLFGEFA